jgi:RNA polymerase sigma-70 factor (ECF subfamily)
MPAIFRYVRGRLGSADEAEDVASAVFEQAWKNAESFEFQGLPARAWLFGIARNVVATQRRKWFRAPPHFQLEGFDRPHHDEALDPELIDLARAVKALGRSQAEVVTLRFIHGLSLDETATVLRTSVDAVKGRQARALATLKAKLSRQ